MAPTPLAAKLSNTSIKTFETKGFHLMPFRYFLIGLLFVLAAVTFAVRNVLNVALLAMVRKWEIETSTSENDGLSEYISEAEFDWNQGDQGLILGAYFYTYTAAQIISGHLTDQLDAVKLLLISQILSVLCSAIAPLAAHLGLGYFILVRMALGAFHGIMFPTCYILMGRWLSPTEKSIAQASISVGANFGIVMIMPITAWFCENDFFGGWPSAFYFVAFINILLVILIALTVTLDPTSNRWVSQEEKHTIERTNSFARTRNHINKTPWLSMVTSVPLWSVMITRGINGLVFYEINSKIPTYMENVLGYSLENNAGINSFFYVAICTTQLISGPLSRLIINKGWLPMTTTRKVFESIALIGTGICLAIIPNLGNQTELIVGALILGMLFNGFTIGGDTPIVPEMAPHIVGTAFGFANTLGCAAGFVAPLMNAAIVGDHVHEQSRWNVAFYSFASFQVVAVLIFCAFATSDPQPWGTVRSPDIEVTKKASVHYAPSVHV